MWVGMGALSQGQDAVAEGLLRSAFSGGAAAGDRVAADYSATFLRSMGVTDSGIPDLPLPELEELLESGWQHQDGFAAALALGQLVTRALAAGDLRSAAGDTLRLLPIGADRAVVEPLPSATMLTVPVRVLVAADQLADAAVLHASLAPLEPLLRNALSRAEFVDYTVAVAQLEADPVASERDPMEEPLSLREAFRFADKAISRVAGPPLDTPTAPAPTSSTTSTQLTTREREVLLLLVDGTANRGIAEALGISSKTVMHHTVAIYRKLGVRGRTEAATWAVRAGLSTSG
jgi:DNA-binding NarL/FixJ family response regulator